MKLWYYRAPQSINQHVPSSYTIVNMSFSLVTTHPFKSMRVGRQIYGCENRQHCVKKILTRFFPKHMTSILSLVDLRLFWTLVFMHLRKQIHSWFFAISWFASGLMKWYWKFSWRELKEADLMFLSLVVLQGFFAHLISGSKLNGHAYAFIEWEVSI